MAVPSRGGAGSRRFFEGSLWESSKRRGDESLKALIREGMKNTSVTCVLAGTYAYSRRWVRYEVARSVIKGNGLLSVKIHRMAAWNGYANQGRAKPARLHRRLPGR